MTAPLVDFHCHLDLLDDFDSAVADAEAAGIYTLTVTTTPRAWPRNYEATREMKHVRAGLGLHPQLVAERSTEIRLWEQFLSQARYIGEVGLDAGPRYYHSLDLQKQVFTRILQKCAEQKGKILTVHSVRAATTVLDLVESHLSRQQSQVVLHWFTGSKSEARRAVDLGCYFSVNGAMVGNDRARALISTLPVDRLLTETDAPFTNVDQIPAKPVDVKTTVDKLSTILNLNTEQLRQTIYSNLKTLLQRVDIRE